MLNKCVQTPPEHRDLWKLVFQRWGREGRCAMESGQLGRRQAHLPRSAVAALPALLSPPGVRSLMGVPVLLLRCVHWEIQKSNEHTAFRDTCILIF